MELFRALGVLIEPPDASRTQEVLRIARLLDLAEDAEALPRPESYADLFLFQLYPYASVYLGPEGMMGGEARDRIAGLLRTLGAAPPTEVDHLSYLLAAYADLAAPQADEAKDARRQRARHAFLWEHLLSWLPGWLHALRRLRPPDLYVGWAQLLDEALRREAATQGPAAVLPLHLRATPSVADPGELGADAFLRSLLAPARSGIVLTRDDLRRAAGELDLGLRAGERRFVLEHLLGQDAARLLAWLAGEAATWTAYWSEQAWLEPVASAWKHRSASTAELLRNAANHAAPEPL